MTVRIQCPDGHLFAVDADRLAGAVACPHCFLVFDAAASDGLAQFARPTKGKSRRSRDDDDDDEDEDDDDDDDDDDEEAEEEEAPIEWTSKKRQVAKLKSALNCFKVAMYATMTNWLLDALGLLVLIGFGVMLFFNSQSPEKESATAGYLNYMLLGIIAAPTNQVAFGAMFLGWGLCLRGPSKSGCRGTAITALILFLTPIFLYIVFFIFAFTVIGRDEHGETVRNRFLLMVSITAGICALMALFMTLVTIGSAAGYMGLNLEKNKPAAVGWFVVGGHAARFGGGFGGAYVLQAVGTGFIGVLIFLGCIGLCYGAYAFGIGAVREVIGVIKKTQASMDTYIRDG